MRRFAAAALLAAASLAAITFLAGTLPAGGPAAVLRDAGQALFALAALGAGGWLARRSSGRLRWAWSLLALSALAALLAGAGEAVYTLWSGGAPSVLSANDAAVAAMPAAIAGLLLFPPEPHLYATRRRAALDVAMVALSLTFIASSFSLPQLFLRHSSPEASWAGLLFPAIDVVLLSVVFLTLRRSQGRLRARLLFVLAGLAVIAISDGASAVLAAGGQLPAVRELLASGAMYGFALVALAPLWPAGAASSAADMPVWPDLIPYTGVAAVAVTAVVISIAHQPMTPYAAASAGGLAMVLLATHLISQAEARAVLRQSKRDQARLREQKMLLDNLIDHAPQGVAAITPDLRLTAANPRLASMLYAPQQLLDGSTIDTFLPADYVTRVFKSLASPDDESTAMYESDCQARRADGSPLWVHWCVTPIRRPDRSVEYFLATFEDVTAKREAEETAVANLAQMEKLNRLKSEFVSMVSHEFRTALVGIQGFSELIRDQEMDVREMKILAEEVYNDSQRLNRMITEMLDFDRLEAGKLRLDLRPLDINELVLAAVERAAASTRTHLIKTELQPALPDVLADSDRITQVLTNLLSNAIKYSSDGCEVCIGTRLAGGSVEVVVRDHGRGIPPEFISRLFGRYERYEDKHAGKIIGTGLGLAITRQIVEMHGGRVTVDSELGRGSEFRFTVPLASTAAAVTRSA